jgi:hypothetical protein
MTNKKTETLYTNVNFALMQVTSLASAIPKR